MDENTFFPRHNHQVPDESDGFPYAPPQPPQPIGDINSAIRETSGFDALFAKATKDNLAPGMIPPGTGGASVISYEEDEFNSEDERFDDHGPFIDLNTLRERPAHLAVFLHFLMSNNNPVPLLFWLVTDVYAQESGSAKEMRRWAYEIYSTFIANNAVRFTFFYMFILFCIVKWNLVVFSNSRSHFFFCNNQISKTRTFSSGRNAKKLSFN